MRITAFVLLVAGTLVSAHTPLFFQRNTMRLAAGGNIAYKPQLGCGACLRGGYVYCVKGEDGMALESDANATTSNTFCCEDATCTQANDVNWVCSNQYADDTYKKNLCPFVKSRCGA